MKVESVKEFILRKNRQFQLEKDMKKPIGMKHISRKGNFYFLREAWTFLPQYNLKDDKVFILERLANYKFDSRLNLKNWQAGNVEYRVGYFIRGKIGRANGKWVWGQFCPLIPQKDFKKLILKAKKEKVIL